MAVAVNAVNDAPANTVPGAQSTNEDTPLVFSTANGNAISIADVDAGTSPVQVTLTAANGVLTLAGTTGLSFVSGDGTADASMSFSGTLTDINAALDGLGFAPDLNYNGAASVQITTDDLGNTGSGGPLSASDSVAVAVNAVNDAPANTVSGAQSTNEDTPLVFSTANGNAISVSDVDAGTSPVQVTLTATHGVLTLAGTTGLSFVSGDGTADASMSFTGELTDINAALDGLGFAPDLNYNGAASVQITTDDLGNTGSGGPLSASDSVAVTVISVNDPPVITSNGGGPNATVSLPENSTAVTTVTATDVDLPPDTLTYAIVGGADQAQFGINASTGELNFVTAPDFEAPTDGNADNIYDVTVQVSDGNGGSDIQAIAVSVTDVNEPPVITSNGAGPTASVSVPENTTTVTTVTATDPDLPAQTLSYAIVGGADQAHFGINASSGALNFVTAPDFEAPTDSNGDNVYNVTVQVSDGNGATSSQSVAVTVTNVNEPPVATNDSAAGIEGNAIGGNVLANDSDPEGSTITAILVTGPAHGTLTFNANGSFSYSPNAHFNGTDSFTYRASDGTFNSNLATVSLSVSPIGAVPPDTPPPPKPPGGPVIPVVEPTHPVTTTRTPSGPLAPGAPSSADPAESHVVQVTLSAGHESASPQFIDLIGKQHETFGGPEQLNVGLLKLLDTARVEGDPGRADHNLISPPVTVELAQDDNFKVNIYAESAKFSAVFLSVGAVWWGLQAGGLMAGLLASLPAWRSFDVLPVLRDEEEDDEMDWESDQDRNRQPRREGLDGLSEEVPG